jgi:F420-non-reducing hydrogenase iron-sulfur subunit
MCSGRVDLAHIFRAFSKGADGVFMGACHLNECNYITHGNYHAQTTVGIAKKVLERLAINPERLRLQFMSGAEAQLYVESVNDFVKKIKELGPLGSSEGLTKDALSFKLDAANELVPYMRLVERERLRLAPMTEEAAHAYFQSDEFIRIFNETIGEKLALSQIISLLRKGPLTTAEVAHGVGLSPSEVSKHLNTTSRHRLVRYDSEIKKYAVA